MGNVDVPLVLLGDLHTLCFPLLMKPYLWLVGMPAKKNKFNCRLSKARVVVENAFGRLKGRWWCLLKRMDNHVENVPHFVSACVVLHDVCEMYGDECQREWIAQPPTEQLQAPAANEDDGHGTIAGQIRQGIEEYL